MFAVPFRGSGGGGVDIFNSIKRKGEGWGGQKLVGLSVERLGRRKGEGQGRGWAKS